MPTKSRRPRPLALLLTALAIASLSLLAGCNDDDLGDGERLAMVPLRYRVDAGLNPGFAHNYSRGGIPTDHERFARETGTPWDDWTRVQPARASLIITEPGLDWRFAREVTLKAFPAGDTTRLTELYYRDQIPLDVGARLDMIPSDFDAKPLLDGDTMGLVLELRRLRYSPPQSLPVTLEWSFAGYVDE